MEHIIEVNDVLIKEDELPWEDIIRGLQIVVVEERLENEEIPNNNNEPSSRTIFGEGYVRGHTGYNAAFGNRYSLIVNDTATSAVRILDRTMKSKKNWVFRLDNPHRGVPHNHININPKISGIKDPHFELPNGSVVLGKGAAQTVKTLNQANKILMPLAIAADTFRTGRAAYTDYNHGTSRNTVQTVASIAGGWGGGYGGALGGAAVGTAIFPGIGTIVGGIFGAISGGIGGSILTEKATEAVSDALEYDIREMICPNCGRTFTSRSYLGENICVWCQQDNFIFFIYYLN